MFSRRFLAVTLIAVTASALLAQEMVGVPGSSIQFAAEIDSTISGNEMKMVLTGTAERTKYFFNVYAIGSYLKEGVTVNNAEELAETDSPKQLHLVMERDVSGNDMAEAFRVAIRLNHPEPEFGEELTMLVECMRSHPVAKGDHVWLTYIPGLGLHVNLEGKTEMKIKNVPFARAVWEIYLGKNNLGETIKKGLVSRL